MRLIRPLAISTTATLGAALVLGAAAPVAAAPEFADATVEAGQGRQVVTVRNRFGCEGQATERFEVTIPEGVIDVTPRSTAGWTIEREIVPSDPYELFGATQTERVGTVRWLGSVADGEYAEFSFMALFGDEPGRYVFPVIQGCADGAEIAWTEAAEDGHDASDLERPALVLEVAAPAPEVDLPALSDSVAELTETVGELDERIAALDERLDGVVTDGGDVRVPALRQQVTDLRDAVDELRQRIEELEPAA